MKAGKASWLRRIWRALGFAREEELGIYVIAWSEMRGTWAQSDISVVESTSREAAVAAFRRMYPRRHINVVGFFQ